MPFSLMQLTASWELFKKTSTTRWHTGHCWLAVCWLSSLSSTDSSLSMKSKMQQHQRASKSHMKINMMGKWRRVTGGTLNLTNVGTINKQEMHTARHQEQDLLCNVKYKMDRFLTEKKREANTSIKIWPNTSGYTVSTLLWKTSILSVHFVFTEYHYLSGEEPSEPPATVLHSNTMTHDFTERDGIIQGFGCTHYKHYTTAEPAFKTASSAWSVITVARRHSHPTAGFVYTLTVGIGDIFGDGVWQQTGMDSGSVTPLF